MILWQYKIEEKTYLNHLFFQFDWLILWSLMSVSRMFLSYGDVHAAVINYCGVITANYSIKKVNDW